MPSFRDNWISNENKSGIGDYLKKSGYSPVFIQLLFNRGLKDIKDIKSYLKPSLKDLHQPDLLPNIKEASDRIGRAISDQEKILIFGDYDTDGIISTAILYNFLRMTGVSADYYIPDRFEEGYDINPGFIRKNDIEGKYNLILCVDCGTNAADVQNEILEGRLSIDIIACDHHEVVNTIPTRHRDSFNRYIVVNPKMPESKYPFKMLSGGGVTFKLIWAILKKIKPLKAEPKDYLKSILDLVAISTVSDLMPLVDENRIIVKKGLELLSDSINKGLNRLTGSVLGKYEKINTYDIGFMISPRLNASGRMKDAGDSLKILLDDGPGDREIDDIISRLNSFNDQRKKLQQSVLKNILEKNDFEEIMKDQRVFISRSADWSEGVLGIVASDIVKKFNIPAIIFREKKGILKGSGRSTEEFDLHNNLKTLERYFKKFGGHCQACGITMETGYYEAFKKELTSIARSKIPFEALRRKFYYDTEITFQDIDQKLIKDIDLLEPFGIGNQRPLFLTKGCLVNSDIHCSKNHKHVFFQLKNSGRIFDAVIFNYNDISYINDLNTSLYRGKSIDILYNIEKDRTTSNHQKTKIIIQSIS